MTHFGMEQWVDYARGLLGADLRQAMAEHLESGCEACRELAGFVEMFAETCRAMNFQTAPESAVRLARVICPSRDRRKRRLRIPVELIFDSFVAPAPVGLRATWQIGWQALYRAGDCSLDVRIEPDLRSVRAALIGQVINHATPDLEMGNIPVYLKSGRRIVAETRSNRFGEFQIEYEQQARLQLCIDLDGGARRIVAPLRQVAAEAPEAVSRLKVSARERRGKTGGEKNS